MVRLLCVGVLLCLAATAVSDTPAALEDGVIDDLGVEALADPDESGEMIHQDENHMSKEDIKSASSVFDVLFPTDEDEEVLKGAEQQVEKAKMSSMGGDAVKEEKKKSVANALSRAEAQESKARDKILAAKGLKETEAATEQLDKAKAKVEKDKEKAAAL